MATPVVIRGIRGMNGTDPPELLSEDQCVDALNVDWFRGALARKRNGATSVSTSGVSFTDGLTSLVRYVPGFDETAAELWALDKDFVFGRLAGSTTWAAPTVVDAATSGIGMVGVGLNSYLHLFYDSAQNRSHVWDGTRVRRAGLATPDAPTPTTQGGSGLSFTRYYRIRTVEISGSNTIRRSEPSTVASITITDDQGVTVTRPTLPTNEHETHWEVEYASASAGPFYLASQVATGTSTYSDTASSISTTTLSPPTGIHFPPPSAKFAVSTDARLVMAGAYETSGGYVTPKPNRVWFTPVVGDRDVGDSERIPTGHYVDVDAAVTGLGGPIQGSVIVFCYRQLWKLVPTGVSDAPFRRYRLL